MHYVIYCRKGIHITPALKAYLYVTLTRLMVMNHGTFQIQWKVLMTWERKILRKRYGLNGYWRTKTNQEIYKRI